MQLSPSPGRWACLLSLCGLLLSGSAFAISLERSIAQLHHKSWIAKDGVPPSIMSIAQTADGYLWLGTAAGLFRFDGVKFEQYQPRQGRYPNATVYALKAQPGGGLWIGWQQTGASFLKDGVLTNYAGIEALGASTVWGFDFDREGAVWAAGVNGIARFKNGRWQKMGPREGYTARKASAVFVDRDGTVGAFSDQGVFLWKPGASAFAPPIGKGDTRQPPQRGPDGRIYYLDEGGIRVIDSLARYAQPDHPYIYRSPTTDSGSMLIDSSGSLWFDSIKGVHRVNPDNTGAFNAEGLRTGTESYTSKDGLSEGIVGMFFEDREGNVWVLTSSGMDRFRQVDVNRVKPASISDRVDGVCLLPGADGTMQLGAINNMASWMRLRADGTVLERRPNAGVSASVQAPDGTVWVAAKQAILGWRTGAPTRTLPLPPDMGPVRGLHVLALGADNTLWAAVTGAGVFRYRDGRWEREPLLPDQGKRTPMSIVGDDQGRMWFGYADNTIALLDRGKVVQYGSAQGLALGRVAALYAAHGQLWAGGQDGIALLRGGRFTSLKLALAKANSVNAIGIAPSGDMWINTLTGPVQLPAAEVRKAIASADHVLQGRMFDALDGLFGVTPLLNPQSMALASDGKVWLATSDAAAWIDPADLLKPVTPPAVLVQALRAGETRYQEPVQLALAPNARDVQIDYTAPVLGTPERVRFRYRLDGYDSQWQDAGERRQAFYTGLPPGDYHFRVMAEPGNGNWGPEGAGVRFSVPPAWYQTWWFKGVGALALLLLGWLLHRFRLRRMEQQYQVQVEVRQAERERIARELHDTLFQGTQALILRFHNAAIALPAHDPARVLMDQALSQADDMLAEGREQVHDLRASDMFGAGAAALIARDGAALAKEFGVRFHWRERGKAREIQPATGHELYRIAMEAITNAARHAEARTISVELAYRPMSLHLTVSDDGKGLPADVMTRGGRDGRWGLRGLHERAARLRARLRIDSAPQQGTVLKLRIPGHLAHGRPILRWPWRRR